MEPQGFGPFDLYEQLGRGARTTVVRGIDRESGRVVALKRLRPPFASEPTHIRSFIREARLTQTLHHPNIVRVFGIGQVEGAHYMSMEWIPGQTLAALIDNPDSRPRVPVGVGTWILRQLLDALDYLMTSQDDSKRPLGIVHRNLSASNIIITPEGDVKVIDFGMAIAMGARHATQRSIDLAEFGYLPPELLAGEAADSRSDLYSAAILVWELLTNQRLFGASEDEQLAKRASHRYVAPSALGARLSPHIDGLLRIALATDPNARWPSAAAMGGVLDLVIRRYGRASGPDAWIAWQEGQSEDDRQDSFPQETTGHSNIGVLTTLPSSSGRERVGLHGYRFGPQSTTALDPVFDPRERHRLLAAKG